jgi:hypothetical protein
MLRPEGGASSGGNFDWFKCVRTASVEAGLRMTTPIIGQSSWVSGLGLTSPNDSSRANLFALISLFGSAARLRQPSTPDADGDVEPLLALDMDRQDIRYPETPGDLEQTPQWAKAIVLAALDAHAPA